MLVQIIFVFLIVIYSGCSNQNQQLYKVSNVSQTELIILSKKKEQETISSFEIKINGKIDGKAKIALLLNDGVYKTENISGNVNIKWGGDWYSDEIQIQYEPQSVNSGDIKLKYSFGSF